MIALLFMATLVQQGGWTVSSETVTVGDTVVIQRILQIGDTSARLRVEPLESNETLASLDDPRVEYQPDAIIVRYVFALFGDPEAPVSVPDMEMVFADGSAQWIPGGDVTVRLASVLPHQDPDSLPPPKVSQAPIARRVLAYPPMFVLGGAALALAIVWAWWRRRRSARPKWPQSGSAVPHAPISAWLSAGEPRAVAAATMETARRAIRTLDGKALVSLDVDELLLGLRARNPSWPLREVEELLRGLERASFAPAVPSDVLLLVDEANELIQRLQPVTEATE